MFIFLFFRTLKVNNNGNNPVCYWATGMDPEYYWATTGMSVANKWLLPNGFAQIVTCFEPLIFVAASKKDKP
jgi:hypothetical protein